MRTWILVFWMALAAATPAAAQLSFGFASGGVSIGINVPVYPQFVRVPGYPVYYAPNVRTNYFFYDGLYWVFEDGAWYQSSWYNGPWYAVPPDAVPFYVLRVPVRYYRHPPPFFHGWRADAPPRWHEHWGSDWSMRHRGWDRWDRHRAPPPAPLPAYQRRYSGDRYPDWEEQARERERNYRYAPREDVTRRHYEEQRREAQQRGPSQRYEQRGEAREQRQQYREQRQQQQFREQRQQEQRQSREQRQQQQQQRESRQREQHAPPPPEGTRMPGKDYSGG